MEKILYAIVWVLLCGPLRHKLTVLKESLPYTFPSSVLSLSLSLSLVQLSPSVFTEKSQLAQCSSQECEQSPKAEEFDARKGI